MDRGHETGVQGTRGRPSGRGRDSWYRLGTGRVDGSATAFARIFTSAGCGGLRDKRPGEQIRRVWHQMCHGRGMSRGSIAMLSRTSHGRGNKLLERLATHPRYSRSLSGIRGASETGEDIEIVHRGAKTTHDVLHGVLLKVVKLKGEHMDRVLAGFLSASRRTKGQGCKGDASTGVR